MSEALASDSEGDLAEGSLNQFFARAIRATLNFHVDPRQAIVGEPEANDVHDLIKPGRAETTMYLVFRLAGSMRALPLSVV